MTLLEQGTPIAMSLAHDQGSWIDKDDARQIAMIQVWRASNLWEGRNGCKFTTFAAHLIRQEFCRLWRREKTIKRGWGVRHDTWDEPWVGEDGLTLAECVEDEGATLPWMCFDDSREKMLAALPSLGPWHQKVVIARFGLDGNDPKTALDVGAELGFSKKLVESLERAAIQEMRSCIDGQSASKSV